MTSPIRLLSLNIYKGLFLDSVIEFIKNEHFDVIHLQEVAKGIVAHNRVDCFNEIKKRCDLQGVFEENWWIEDPLGEKGSMGNATFYSKDFLLKEKRVTRFIAYQKMDCATYLDPKKHPRSALLLHLEINNRLYWFINTHQAWGPTPYDEPYKINDAQILSHAIKSLENPFVLSGDFNVVNTTSVIQMFGAISTNISELYSLSNTLNPKVHKAKHLFPMGLAVDFIFIDPVLGYKNFKLIEDRDLSDHFGLSIDIV